MYVLNFMFEHVLCEIGILGWLGIIILRPPEKGGSVEILAQSSISSEFQTKVNFKVTASRYGLL